MYTLIKSGPDVPADEVEVPHRQSVEVMVMWGTIVLHVSHLTPPRSFYVGEESGKNVGCDFFIPAEKIGTTRLRWWRVTGRRSRWCCCRGRRGISTSLASRA